MTGLWVACCPGWCGMVCWGVLGYRKFPFVALDYTGSFGHCKPTQGPNRPLSVHLKVGKLVLCLGPAVSTVPQ